MAKYVVNNKSIHVVADIENKEDILKVKVKVGREKGLKNLSKTELLEMVQLLNVKYKLNLE